MRTPSFVVLLVWLSTALPSVHAQAPAPSPAPQEVPAALLAAQAWLSRLVAGVGDGMRVAYDLQGDTVHFRIDVATLTQPGRPVAQGILEFDRDGLRRFRIEDGVAYDRHRAFRQRARSLGLAAPEMQVLLESEAQPPGAAAARGPAAGLRLDLLRGADGGRADVEGVTFDGRGPATADAPDGEPVAAWRVRIRLGRGPDLRRYEATVEPFGGAIIAMERR